MNYIDKYQKFDTRFLKNKKYIYMYIELNIKNN